MYLEYYEGMPWFHTDVFKWSSSIKKEFIHNLNTLQNLLGTPIVAMIPDENSKLKKFAKLIGFKYEDFIMGIDGNKHTIFSRSL